MNFVFDVGRARAAELHARVDGNDPAASALILVVLALSGIEDDDAMKEHATLSAVLSASSNEVTNTGYARKTLTDSSITAAVVSSGRVTLPFPTQTWTTVSAGDAWRKLLVCYDGDTGAGTDANIIPVTAHDLLLNGQAIVPAGTDIIVAGSAGYLIA